MSHTDSAPKLLVVLTEDNDPDRVVVDMRSFLRFAEEITFGLEDMVDKWQGFAAPCSYTAALRRQAASNLTSKQ